MFSYLYSFFQSQETPAEILPSIRHQKITDNPVLVNLKPQRILLTCEDGTYGYDDSYSGVIVTKWTCIDDEFDPYYYSLHLDRDAWDNIVGILNDNETKFEIISDLPDGVENGNFPADLAKNWFGLDINY